MTSEVFTPIHACRSCGTSSLLPVLDLGRQPLANALRVPGDKQIEATFPLATVVCPSCSLVQLTGTVTPEVMFDRYHYFSSYSTTMVAEMGALAERLTRDRGLGDHSMVVEVASNDGYLLAHYRDLGVPVLGIEPAANVAEVAIAAGIPTRVEYFGLSTAAALVAEGVRAGVLHANNVMAHVPEINDFMAGISMVLADGGVAVIETPYLVDLVDSVEFDTIYHEHVFYHSVTAVDVLARRHGLVVADVEHLAIHGGSLRLFLQRTGDPVSPAVADALAAEQSLGVTDAAYYAGFAERVADLKHRLRSHVTELVAGGGRVAAYGAAAKGAVLLNHFGIGADLIDFVVDRNPHKQGLEMPGVAIPISPPERLLVDQPDEVVLLTWNFATEIIEQQVEYLSRGGAFVIPIPELKVVRS
jgi:SAM-dependent methyltransferase